MKVLFVSSGNTKTGISSIIKNQGNSLKKEGIELDFFTIKGKGILGYLRSIPKIRKQLEKNKYDIVHAHYSLSAFAVSLAGANPLVVSLMGSDVKSKSYYRFFIKLFNWFFWSAIIVKSLDMRKSISINHALVIPNGVDFCIFYPKDKNNSQTKLSWDSTKKHILFPSNPTRYEKNYQLLGSALNVLNDNSIEVHSLVDIPHSKIPIYLNAADVVVLTSLWEGSPNVIKEAMACSCPIVATDVGDIKELISETEGCYISTFEISDVALKILKAIEFSKNIVRTNGREKVKHLDDRVIAKKIINIYEEILNHRI